MEQTKWNVGAQLYEFVPPDIYHVHLLAPCKPDEGLEAVRIVNEEVIPKVGDVYALIEMSPGAGTLSSETRKAVSGVKPSWKGAAVVGGSTLSRAVMSMALRTLSLLSGTQAPTRMFKTLEEGRAFINELRATKMPKAASPTPGSGAAA